MTSSTVVTVWATAAACSWAPAACWVVLARISALAVDNLADAASRIASCCLLAFFGHAIEGPGQFADLVV